MLADTTFWNSSTNTYTRRVSAGPREAAVANSRYRASLATAETVAFS